MKKGLLTIATLLVAIPALFAQQGGKIDVPAIKKNIEKSDLDMQDPKKNQKGAVWLERGDIFLEAATAPTKGLARGMDLKQIRELDSSMPEPKQLPKLTVGKNTFDVYEFDRYIVYMSDGKLNMWTENMTIDPEAFDKAAKAYSGSYLIDGNSAKKAVDGLMKTANIVKDRALTYLSLHEYDKAGPEFMKSYTLQKIQPLERVDTTDLYYAGMSFTVSDDFDKAIEALQQVEAMNYYSKGDVYYYLYFAYVGKKDMENARKALMDGLAKFPDLDKLAVLLPAVYASLPEADINEILPYVNKVLEKDPKNLSVLLGMAQIYTVRNEPEKALEFFKKVSDVDPQNYSSFYNAGLLVLQKADAKVKKLRDLQDSMSNDEVSKQADEILDIYAESVPYLKRANEINPSALPPVELLKNVTMRLRDKSEEWKAMYTKYEEMYKSMGGE